MRGISQFLGLICVGVWAFSRFFSVKVLLRYWMFWCYVFASFISSLYSTDIVFVFMQVTSLSAVLLFFVAYYEYGNKSNVHCNYNVSIFHASALIIGLVTVISLILYVIYPRLVIDMQNDFRFHGLYGKSGMMASASSILIGIALLGNYKVPVKILILFPSLACLLLTLSRTFWIASAISIVSVLYIYKLIAKKYVILGILLIILSSVCSYVMDFEYGKISKLARPESVGNLTGRVALWNKSMNEFYEKPLFGNGLTAGSEVLSGRGGVSIFSKTTNTGREMSRRTSHNGYIQSLLDTGVFGFVFYFSIILYSIANYIKYDKRRIYPVELYILILMAIANIGESMIYAASSYSAVLFWAMAVKSFQVKMAI